MRREIADGGAAPLRRRLVRCAGRVADAFLPRACACCDRTLTDEQRGFCDACVAMLPGTSSRRCRRCALPLPAGDECPRCESETPLFDRTVALADYAPPFDRLLVALKFGGDLSLARPLAALAARRLPLEALEPPDLVAPVPLAPSRLAWRGYNQALEIARPLARELGLPLAPGLLRRVRDTAAQSTLDLAARSHNLDGAFDAGADARGRRVLVVDDVMTTGATLRAVAGALRAAGARGVINLVAARTA